MKLPYDPDLARYPIGKFRPEKPFDHYVKSRCIRQISILPLRLMELTCEMTEAQYNWCYRKDGWSIRQVIHHLADSHMHAFLRLKWTLNETTPRIKAYDEDAWSRTPEITSTPIIASLQLLDGLHVRWAHLLDAIRDDQWTLEYFHPEQQTTVSLSDYLQSYAWHCEHHYHHILLALDHEGKYQLKPCS